MPITKNSSLLAAVAPAAVAHVGQNYVLSNLIKTKQLQKRLADRAQLSFRGEQLPKLTSEAATGGVSGVFPEVGVLDNMVTSNASKFREFLVSKGIQPESLTNRDLVLIRRTLRGDFEKALKSRGTTFDPKDALSQLVENTNKGIPREITKEMLESALNSPKAKDFLQQISKDWKDNPVLGTIGSGISKTLGSPTAGIENTRLHGAVRPTTEGSILAGMFFADAPTAAVNVGKKLLNSEMARKIPGVGQVQNTLNKKFVTEPITKKFVEGVSGDPYKLRQLRQRVDKYGLNPVVGGIKEFSYDFGKALRQSIGAEATDNYARGLSKAQASAKNFRNLGSELKKEVLPAIKEDVANFKNSVGRLYQGPAKPAPQLNKLDDLGATIGNSISKTTPKPTMSPSKDFFKIGFLYS